MTQITATILTKSEFQEKEAELNKLATSIDLYSGTEMSEQKQETVQTMFDELEKNMYALDCAYLNMKLEAYREIYELIKE